MGESTPAGFAACENKDIVGPWVTSNIFMKNAAGIVGAARTAHDRAGMASRTDKGAKKGGKKK